MSQELHWGIIGVGVIANELAVAMEKHGRKPYAVWNRTYQKAVSYAEKYQIEQVYEQVEDLLMDENVDIVYVATVHNTHYEFIKQALLHGKHVLAEKAITLNSRELEELMTLAEEKQLVLAEAMTIWHMPIYKKLWEMVKGGELGKANIITMNFGCFKEYDMMNRFFNKELAGGAMLDIGVYALSAMRGFLEEIPNQIMSQWEPAPSGVDENAVILLKNPQKQMATVSLSLHSKQPKRAMISCDNGYIEIMEYPRADKAKIVNAVTGDVQEIEIGDKGDALYYEIEDMEAAIQGGDVSIMHLDYSRDVMNIMTKLRKEWGVRYPGEDW